MRCCKSSSEVLYGEVVMLNGESVMFPHVECQSLASKRALSHRDAPQHSFLTKTYLVPVPACGSCGSGGSTPRAVPEAEIMLLR